MATTISSELATPMTPERARPLAPGIYTVNVRGGFAEFDQEIGFGEISD